MRTSKMSERRRRLGVLGSAGLLVATTAGALLAGAGPAGAVANTSTPNPTAPSISYEADCTVTSPSPATAPFIVSLTGNTTVNTAFPAGVGFGYAGVASLTAPGAVIAGVMAALTTTTSVSVAVKDTIGPTDANSTGSYNFTNSYASQAVNGGTVLATWTSGSTTLSGNFSALVAGDYVAGAGIVNGSLVTAASATSATITIATTAANVANEVVGWGGNMTFSTAAGLVTGATSFTTAGVSGQTAGVGVTSVTSVGLTVEPSGLTLAFGGAAGTSPVGAATTTPECLETGITAASVNGPAQAEFNGTDWVAGTAPLLPAGFVTPIATAAPTFQPAAYVNLVEPAPVANAQSVTLGVGGTKTVTLSTTSGGNPSYPVTSCALVAGSISNARLSVSFSNSPTVCAATLTDTGSGVATVTFQFTASDAYPTTSAPGTVTVTIGTPPVDQQINQTVTGGLLVLSCAAPNGTQVGLTTCPLVTLPGITLNGLQQTATGAASTIYVSDNRGDPTVGWTLSTYMVPTAGNPNTSCDTLADFCDSTAAIGTHALNPNGQIAASNLAISTPVCAAYTGNLNSAPTAGTAGSYPTAPGALTLCTAAAGESGGTFTMGTNFTLTIPSSVYAGLYEGTVEYLVS